MSALSQASRIPRGSSALWRVFPADAVDAAEDIGLGDLRRGTADAEPAAGVDHQQAAVGVLDEAGRVKVGVVAGDEILGADAEAGAVALDDVALNTVRIELGREVTSRNSGPKASPR